MPPTTSVPTTCPACAGSLAWVDPVVPWCPSCEWNLGAYEPPKNKTIPKRFIRRARRDHDRAFALDERLFTRLTLSEATRPGLTLPRVVLWLTSGVLLLLPLLLLVVGAWLVVRPPWVVGALLILIAVELRPRFPRIGKDLDAVTEAEAPITFALLKRVGTAMNAPTPRVLYIETDFNAFCGRSGIRRRPVLGIGLSLWGSLSPQARVALLGHEFGHLVNGDPRQGLLTQPALTTFGRLAELFNPSGMEFRDYSGNNNGLIKLITAIVLAPLFWIPLRIHLFLNGIAAQDARRAEYLADRIAVRVGGVAAARELLQTLLVQYSVRTMVRRAAATSSEPTAWFEAALAGRTEVLPRLRRYEQRSIRMSARILASHPADGLRYRLIDKHPAAGAEITVRADEWAASDRELSRHYARVGRALQHQ